MALAECSVCAAALLANQESEKDMSARIKIERVSSGPVIVLLQVATYSLAVPSQKMFSEWTEGNVGRQLFFIDTGGPNYVVPRGASP